MVCTHDRIIERSHRQPGRVIYDWRHYLAVLQRKPGGSAPRPGFTGGQNSRRIARYGTDTKEEDLEAVFTRCLTVH